MKLQHLTIIFIIIILPIALVVGEYINTQIDTTYLQTQYNKKLQDSTYDAIRAFQLNTVNNKYSSVSDSKIRDIEASVNTFYNSLGTAMGASGYNKEELKEFIPAMLYTLYDGYYIYGKYYNFGTYDKDGNHINEGYQYGLKPYIYYSCRYKNGGTDIVINYTLDNSITVYGKVSGEDGFITKSGYVIDPDLVKNETYTTGRLDEYDWNFSYLSSVQYITTNQPTTITISKEIIKEKLPEVDSSGKDVTTEYEYVYYNNQKIYKYNDKDEYFLFKNNQKEDISDEGRVIQRDEITPRMYAKMLTTGGHLYSNSAVEYYVKAREFSNWLSSKLGNIKQDDAVDSNGQKIKFSTKTDDTEYLFKFNSNNNPLLEGSVFNENRLGVIRYSIESNLASAIANFNVGTSNGYEYYLPKFTEEDWDKIENNISISVFMQGIPIKSKYYSNYCVITNDKNQEVVTEDSIYILAKNKNGIIEAHMPGCKALIDNSSEYDLDIGKSNGYKIVDFERQTQMKTEREELYYYPQAYTRCYHCIVNVSQIYDINSMIEGRIKRYDQSNDKYNNEIILDVSKASEIRKEYLTALGRTRYDLYRSNGSFGI